MKIYAAHNTCNKPVKLSFAV